MQGSYGNACLRLEPCDGSPAREYRITPDANVEVRTLGESNSSDGSAWQRVTPHQLSLHVEQNSVVAHWLQLRLGWRSLLQACVNDEKAVWSVADDAFLEQAHF